MTASTVNGTEITNLVATPIVGSVSGLFHSTAKHSIGHIAAATTSIDEADDIMLLVALPSNAIVHGVFIKNDDLDSNGAPALAADVGVYYSGIGEGQIINGNTVGTAIDVDLFGSAVTTLQSANVTWAEVTNEAQNITNYGTELWSAGGLTSDPGGLFLIGLKITTAAATAAAGDIVMKVEYSTPA